MPLHDWSDLAGWEGVHDIWIVELLRCVKPQLPAGYRAHIGSSPTLGIGTSEKPDVSVRHWPDGNGPNGPASSVRRTEPDVEVATLTLDPDKALYVTTAGRLVAAVELVSPRNKDRPASRAAYLARYLHYLNDGVHLVLADVHPRPAGFSFADALSAELNLAQAPLPTPTGVAYRVGEPAPSCGRFLAVWRRPFAMGQRLPEIPLPL
ncbi:MAG TPA: DUF4058 family protein, partial [Gemmataceae bacterium]|nr:DUF4058 family protein [Gemmataceae bacterium]